MNKTEQFMIYIGHNDSQTRTLSVTKEELINTVSSYFEKNGIDFSIAYCNGGYTYNDGKFCSELTMSVNIIGKQNTDILKLSRGLSMFMNQESVLVTRTRTETVYV